MLCMLILLVLRIVLRTVLLLLLHQGSRLSAINVPEQNVARLTRFFNDYNWNGLMLGIDCGTLSVDQAFADFDNIFHYALEQIVGYSTVTVRERDPPYITPFIKVLLRKRNKLLRRGKVYLARDYLLPNRLAK